MMDFFAQQIPVLLEVAHIPLLFVVPAINVIMLELVVPQQAFVPTLQKAMALLAATAMPVLKLILAKQERVLAPILSLVPRVTNVIPRVLAMRAQVFVLIPQK